MSLVHYYTTGLYRQPFLFKIGRSPELTIDIVGNVAWKITGDVYVILTLDDHSEEFKDLVKDKWKVDIHGHAMFRLVKNLKALKPHLNKLNWKNGNLFVKVSDLKSKFHYLQGKINLDPSNKSLRAEGVKLLKEYKEGEAANDEEKLLRHKDKVTWLKDDGNRYENNEVAEQFVKHFEVFLGINPLVTSLKDEDVGFFENKVSEDEATLMKLNMGGGDGFNAKVDEDDSDTEEEAKEEELTRRKLHNPLVTKLRQQLELTIW
ncbi:hypothetical protein Tco_0127751 [Tanacetum coccineum]